MSTIGPTVVRPRDKIFKTKVFRRLENAILNLVFATQVFQERHYRARYGWALEQNFNTKVLTLLESAILILVFARTMRSDGENL